MITSVKNVDYSFLFQDASDQLWKLHKAGVITLDGDERECLKPISEGGTIGRFTSLEQYFSRLGDLVNNAVDANGESRYNFIKYLMLPLDEPAFEIDANSRTINIPADFKKSGVSVQGDVVAETLFFRIDRFFDYMDFLEADAFVQWKLPNGEEGASIIPYIDYESEQFQGKIILVWPLTQRVTGQAGNLTFSIRFLKKDADGKLAYSWNTLPCVLSIKQALQSDFEYTEIEDASGLFTTIITNSENVSTSDPVDPPSFAAPGYKFISLENAEVAYLNRSATRLEAANGRPEDAIEVTENALHLRAAAHIKDSGLLSYTWKHAPLASGGVSNTLSGAKVGYELTSDTKAVENKEYYIYNENVPTGYERVDFDTATGNGYAIYERYAYYDILKGEAPVTGTYILEAHHRFGYSSAAEELKIHIPGPADIDFATDLDDSKNTGNFISSNGAASLNVAINRETVPATAWQGVTYDWRYSNVGPEAIEDTLELHETYDATTDTLTMVDAQPGWYKVDVTTMVNRDEKTIHSKIQRLTKIPQPPVLKYPYRDANDKLNIVAVEGRDEAGKPLTALTLKCEYDAFTKPALESDAIKFEWLDDGVEIQEGFEHIGAYSGYNSDTLTINCSKLPENVAIRCRVTNILNNMESEPVETGTFSVLFDSTTTV